MKMNDLLKKITCNAASLDMERYSLISDLGFILYGILPQTPNGTGYLAIGMTIGTGIAVTTAFVHEIMRSYGVNHIKEVQNIQKYYQELIHNYNKLNRVFDLNDPVQIHTMFNYLVHNGYLSSGKIFEFSDEQAVDIKTMMGANIITGKGVCRHIAPMLTDILNDYNVEAGSLIVCVQEPDVYTTTLKKLREQESVKEELFSLVQSYYARDEELKEIVMKDIKDVIADSSKNDEEIVEFYYAKDEENFLNRISGNHVITYAYKDGKSYYLDPTQDRIYSPIEYKTNGNVSILSDTEIYAYPRVFGTLSSYNNRTINDKMKKRMAKKYPSLDVEEEETSKMQEETLDMCMDNIDIFEQFYKENEELYDETSNMVLSLKKKIRK